MVFSLRSVLRAATAAALLAVPTGVLADSFVGCVNVVQPFDKSTTSSTNSPESCAATCSAAGYVYYGVSQQYVAPPFLSSLSKTI